MRKRQGSLRSLFIISVLLLSLTLAGCGQNSPYKILNIKLDPPTVAPGEKANLFIDIGQEKNKQVAHTDDLKVTVQAASAVKVEGQVTSFEEAKGNEVKITLRPGSNLPRQFKYAITAPREPGEYKLTVQLDGNGDKDEKSVNLQVKGN